MGDRTPPDRTPPRRNQFTPSSIPAPPVRLNIDEINQRARNRELAQREVSNRIRELEDIIDHLSRMVGSKYAETIPNYRLYQGQLAKAKREYNLYSSRDKDIADAQLLVDFGNTGRVEQPVPERRQFQPLQFDGQGKKKKK